jgi:hypothetical protein
MNTDLGQVLIYVKSSWGYFTRLSGAVDHVPTSSKRIRVHLRKSAVSFSTVSHCLK